MKTAIRSSTINIDTIEPNGFEWINTLIQRLEIDDSDNVVSISPKDKQMHRRVDEVISETVLITDPVTGQSCDISVAGTAVAIREFIVKWMLEDYPEAYFDEVTGRVFIDASQ